MATMSFVVHLDAFSFASERRYFLAETQVSGRCRERSGWVPITRANLCSRRILSGRSRSNSSSTQWHNRSAHRCSDALWPLKEKRMQRSSSFATSQHAPVALCTASMGSRDLSCLTTPVRPLYSFEGLAAFKSKLQPEQWEDSLRYRDSQV